MKLRIAITVAAAAAMAGIVQTAQAQVTLAQLLNGGTITVDDKVFSGFGLTDSGALANFDPTTITVSASYNAVIGADVLDFSGPIFINNLAGNQTVVGDLKLSYTVTASAGAIAAIDQEYTPNAPQGPGAPQSQISIGETAVGSGASASSQLSLNPLIVSQQSGPLLQLNPPQTALSVEKDILITAAADSEIGLSDVQQSYHQVAVPEVTTMIAGALLLLPFGASTLRILRRNRMA